jgi:hypothetical protein
MFDTPSTSAPSLDHGAVASQDTQARADTLVTKVRNYTKTLPALHGDRQTDIVYWHFNLDPLCMEVSKVRTEMGKHPNLGRRVHFRIEQGVSVCRRCSLEVS